jgi:hypothetical protein
MYFFHEGLGGKAMGRDIKRYLQRHRLVLILLVLFCQAIFVALRLILSWIIFPIIGGTALTVFLLYLGRIPYETTE